MKAIIITILLLSFSASADMLSLPRLKGVIDNQTEIPNAELTLTLTIYKMKKLGPLLGHGEATPVATTSFSRIVKEDGSFKFPRLNYSTRHELFVGMSIHSAKGQEISVWSQPVSEFHDETWLPMPMAIRYQDIEIDESEYLEYFSSPQLFSDQKGSIFFKGHGSSNYRCDNKPVYLGGL